MVYPILNRHGLKTKANTEKRAYAFRQTEYNDEPNIWPSVIPLVHCWNTAKNREIENISNEPVSVPKGNLYKEDSSLYLDHNLYIIYIWKF